MQRKEKKRQTQSRVVRYHDMGWRAQSRERGCCVVLCLCLLLFSRCGETEAAVGQTQLFHDVDVDVCLRGRRVGGSRWQGPDRRKRRRIASVSSGSSPPDPPSSAGEWAEG